METRLYKDQERPLPYTFFAIQAKKLNIKYIQGCKLLEHNVVSSPVCFFLPQLFLADIVVWDTEKNMKLFPFKVPKQGIAV